MASELRNAPSRGHSSLRATADSLLWVVILIFLNRTFVAELFLIPTGSMAPTLLGRHWHVCCPECDHLLTVNAPRKHPDTPTGAMNQTTCDQCGALVDLSEAPVQEGDRVWVLKNVGHTWSRNDVVAFRSPDEPRQLLVKRIVGLPGETLRLRDGDVEVRTGEGWSTCAKSSTLARAMALTVFDDRTQNKKASMRWRADRAGAWKYTSNGYELVDDRPAELRYHHRAVNESGDASIDDMLLSSSVDKSAKPTLPTSCPVRDLLLELVLAPSENCDEFTIALTTKEPAISVRWSKRLREYAIQAGSETPVRLPARLETKPTLLRLERIDGQVYFWEDEHLRAEIPVKSVETERNSYGPWIRVHGRGTRVTDLVLRRDIHYRQASGQCDPSGASGSESVDPFFSAGQAAREWELGPDEYFMLGDNSADSFDSRHWRSGPGVAERLILGKVYLLQGPRERSWLGDMFAP